MRSRTVAFPIGRDHQPIAGTTDAVSQEPGVGGPLDQALMRVTALRQHQPMTLATNRLVHVDLGMPEAEPFLAEHLLVVELLLAETFEAAAAALEAPLRSAVHKHRERLTKLKQSHRPVVPPYLQPTTS